MGKLLFLFTFLLFSCSQKVSTLEEYERKNPYPSGEEKVEYASRGSLMPKGYEGLYAERRASKVGDIIFIQVVESIRAIESVSSQTQRSSSFQQGVSSFFGISPGTLSDLGARGSGQVNTKGSGRVQQTGVLTTKLAGRVMRIYPNQTMLVEGKKSITVEGSQREVVLRGIVRPEDIDSTNTVSTDRMANLEVIVDGKGFMVEGGTPGWLARVLAKVLPF